MTAGFGPDVPFFDDLKRNDMAFGRLAAKVVVVPSMNGYIAGSTARRNDRLRLRRGGAACPSNHASQIASSSAAATASSSCRDGSAGEEVGEE